MKPKVYLETKIPSYLTAWPSRDLVRAAHQQLTREWWETRRSEFELYASPIVMQEASAGDPVAARERLKSLERVPLLDVCDAATSLAEGLAGSIPLPPNASVDAFHIATAAVSGMDFLLTWNCAHIANATFRGRIEAVVRAAGYEPPTICTPEELMGDSNV